MKFTNLINNAVGLVKGVVKHWNYPPNGKEVPYKEYAFYGIGGMGINFTHYLTTCFLLGTGNVLLGTCLGIQPVHIQIMATICTLSNFLFLYLRGLVFDNLHSKLGKFKPIVLTVIPLVIICSCFLFLPINQMIYSRRLIYVFLFTFIVQVLVPYVDESIAGIGYVISTSSQERANIITVYSIVFSFAPTVTGFIGPILIGLIPDGYANILAYRYIMIPTALFGIALSLFAVFGVNERIIKPKTYVPKTNVIKAMGEIFHNKYWWIRNFASWFTFLESASSSIFVWLFIYGRQDLTMQGFANLVLGTSALIAMLCTAPLIKRIGNKNILLLNNFTNILFLFGMLIFRNNLLMFTVFLYLNNISNGLALVYNPVIDAQIRDYQQYKSNKRIDGVFASASMINIPITLATGFVVPFVYECFGLTNNYNILYNPVVRNNMFATLLIMSVIGALANFIPFLFYDYPEEQHKSIIRTLRLRTLFTDYMDNKLTNEQIKTAIEDYREVNNFIAAEVIDNDVLKTALINAKSMPKSTKEEKKARLDSIHNAKIAIRNNNILKRDKENLHFYLDELNKHQDMVKTYEYNLCKKFVNFGLLEIEKLSKEEAESMILDVAAESKAETDKDCIELTKKFTKKFVGMISKINKSYPNGIIVPDFDAIDKAQELPDKTKEDAKVKSELIKKLIEERQTYDSATAFYEDMVLKVKRFDGGLLFDKIEAMYENACQQVEEENERKRIEQEALKIEKERSLKVENSTRKKKKAENNLDNMYEDADESESKENNNEKN